MSSTLRLQALEGSAIAAHLTELALLRTQVFAKWPYLYAATPEYEAQYLQVYLRSSRSFAVLVWDGANCVGASTALPLADATAEAQQPFAEIGYDLNRISYFGESVVLPAYRRQGLGARFFELREAHARRHGLTRCAFCSVDRPSDHPARPADYRGNEHFWRGRGYTPEPQLRAALSWPDLGSGHSTSKSMSFWLRDLPA